MTQQDRIDQLSNTLEDVLDMFDQAPDPYEFTQTWGDLPVTVNPEATEIINGALAVLYDFDEELDSDE